MTFSVSPYSIEELRAQIRAGSAKTSLRQIDQKSHLSYFEGYFSYVGARTIVVETDYVDRDYLEDFAAHYARCFHAYRRKCTRLHFFSTELTTEQFSGAITRATGSPSEAELQSAYLGFIVVKPLPETVIGRTCLKTYEPEGRRSFPITRDYPVNLFGISLTVNTLAFQEQDSVVAACATSALWSAFHGTGILFHHNIHSPVEITRAATHNSPSRRRAIPNHGLDADQMAQAIRSVGLEPHHLSVLDDADHYQLKGNAYAYLRGRIPTLFLLHLIIDTGTEWVLRGGHAVAITGFSMGGDLKPLPGTGLRLLASKIDKLYVHDDGVGPFARMEIDGSRLQVKTNAVERQELPSITTGWAVQGTVGRIRAVPDILLVPLYHKIRLSYSEVHDAIMLFDSQLRSLARPLGLPQFAEMAWDIYLVSVEDLKTEIRADEEINEEARRTILLSDLPKFIWRATALLNETKLLDLFLDATDLSQGKLVAGSAEYHPAFAEYVRQVCALDAVRGHGQLRPAWPIIEHF